MGSGLLAVFSGTTSLFWTKAGFLTRAEVRCVFVCDLPSRIHLLPSQLKVPSTLVCK